MEDKKSSKAGHGRHPNSLANLKPVQEGDPPRNPTGRNQYTYRDNSEKEFARVVEERIAEVIERTFDEAISGKKGSASDRKLIFERALPAVKHVDVELPGTDVAGLVDALASHAARLGAGGSHGESDDGAAGGSE